MSFSKSFFICGGDLRQIKLAEMLANSGHRVSCYGFDKINANENIEQITDYQKAVSRTDTVVLPLPYSRDEINVNITMSDNKLSLCDLFDCLTDRHFVLGGKIGDDFFVKCQSNNIKIADYFEREELVVLNVIPTVEGAIQTAMEETPYTIHGSRCLVLGYGRIGKYLSQALRFLGANVSVEARKQADMAWIKANGHTGVHISNLVEKISDFDIIFNTVPHRILDSVMLKKISKDTLIIDLASNQGGVDFASASEFGLKVIWALSLPGKVAPITSAKIIKDTIMNIVAEWG